GRGVMAFTVLGKDHFPSAGYAAIDREGVGTVHIAAEGLGPQDGFSGYKAFNNPPRPRWGDYGSAVALGNDVWIASEYTGQKCDARPLAVHHGPAAVAQGAVDPAAGPRGDLQRRVDPVPAQGRQVGRRDLHARDVGLHEEAAAGRRLADAHRRQRRAPEARLLDLHDVGEARHALEAGRDE